MSSTGTIPKCPHCGQINDAIISASPGKPPRPEPGSVSICGYCNEVSLFDDDLSLIIPSPFVARLLTQNPGVREARENLKRIQAAHRRSLQ